MTKPDVDDSVSAKLSAPDHVKPGDAFTYTVTLKNNSPYTLNGTQVKLLLPPNVSFTGTTGDTTSVHGNEVVISIGRVIASTVAFRRSCAAARARWKAMRGAAD